MRTLLIDGDDVAWRAALRADREAVPSGDRGAFLEADLVRRVDAACARFEASRAVLALSDKQNWRRALWPTYKAHRAARRRPAGLEAARALLRERWRARLAPGLEADDLLGLMATGAPLDLGAPGLAATAAPEPVALAALRSERAAAAAGGLERGDERVVLSRDKDLLTTPGLHGGVGGAVRRISPDEADRRHAQLVLTGDAADGYRGCPRIGAVRAERILAAAGPAPPDRWRAVLQAYRDAGLDREDALVQARLARVLRVGDLDAAGRPILFSPPW